MQISNRRRWLAVAAVAATATALGTLAPGIATATTKPPASPIVAARPNIVFVLTDDLAWNLVKYMPQVQRLQHDGMTFTNYTVTDSLCCPSRSSIFTGNFPHDTGVFTNGGSDGGYAVFNAKGNQPHTYATKLRAQNYATGMMGKYLNGYQPADHNGGSQPYVPPGWSRWDVAGNGYPEYNYDLNQNHKIVHYASTPADYLTDVVSGLGTTFIRNAANAHKPFALEIATFAPHAPYTPAPQDLNKFPGLTAPRGPAFNKLPANAPSWLASNSPLTAGNKTTIDTAFRKRVQAVQAVDRMIGHLRAVLKAAGVAKNTYIVFSSDNGYHMGEYRLMPGKMTAFDTDIRVPLIVAGPGVPAGRTSAAIVQNIDLAPTFERLAGTTVASNVDGRSLVPLLRGGSGTGWRTGALIEHHGPDTTPNDPDMQTVRNGNPTTYEALRTATYTYVEYNNGEREYYNRTTDPNELHNIAATLSANRLAALHKALAGLKNCHTHDTCWAAAHVAA